MAIYVNNTRPSIRPTLNLDFAGSRSVDSRISFSRASQATSYDKNGLLQYSFNDQPRIDFDPSTKVCKGLLVEEARTNLITSQYFDTWSNTPGRFLGNRALAPDGTYTAYKIIATTSNVRQYIWRSETAISNATVTFSVFVKAAGYTTITLGARTDDATHGVGDYYGSTVNITSGTPVGNDWYRHSYTYSIGASAALSLSQIVIGAVNGFAGDGTSGIYVWGAQLEVGTFPASYVPSTSTFSSRSSSATYFDSLGTLKIAGPNQARYGYAYDSVSGKWVSQGLIVEPAATNLYDSSTGALTTLTSTTITLNATTAPDGTTTAHRYTVSGNYVYRYWPSVIGGGATHTWSFFVKPVNNYLKFANGGTFGSFTYQFDFSTSTPTVTFTNGSNTTNLGYTLIPVGNGWWRFSGSITAGGSTGYMEVQWSYGTSGTADFYLWGIQCETGSTVTSYIPTASSTVTRAADSYSSASTTRAKDSVQLTGSNFSSWYNQYESTMYAEADLLGVSSSGSWAHDIYCFGSNGAEAISSGATNTTGAVNYGRSAVGGTTMFTPSFNTMFKIAHSFSQSTANHYGVANGGSIYGPSAYGVPYQDSLTIGDSPDQALRTMSGHIRKIAYYPKALSTTEMQTLTL